MNIGDKIYVEVTIDSKIENSQGMYYVGHIDQYEQNGSSILCKEIIINEAHNIYLTQERFGIITGIREIKECR